MVMPLPVAASVVDAEATPAATKITAALTVPGLLLVAMLSIIEEGIDALTTRDARSMAREPRDREARSRDAIIARSTIRTHGSTSITTLRDPNTTTRLR